MGGRLAILVLAFLAPACRTADRLWRISPFEGGGSSERVNLWPLAYHDGDETSVLWPLFDIDDQGFALRPLVAKDGTNLSVLFPLASFDTREGEGWFFPFYRFGEHRGLFPLTNFGSLSYVGPVWWTKRASGLFPLAAFGEFNYVGLAWWRSAPEGQQASGGLFPLALFGPTSYIGPAWWSSHWRSYGLFPLFGINALGAGVDHVGPVWWDSSAASGYDRGLFPFFAWGEGGQRFALLPFYSHDLGPGARTQNYLMGLGHSSRRDARDESWLLPLYYHRAEPERSDTALVPFFWKRTRGDDSRVYTLLGNRSVDPDSSSLNLYPLWWSNESGGSAWRMLFPFFYFARDGDERTLLTPLGGRGWSRTGESAFVNVLGPLYHHSQSTRRDESRTAFLWPLFERHRIGERRTTRVAGLFSSESTPDTSEASYAFGLGHSRSTPVGSSHRLWPFYSWSDERKAPGPVYALTLYGAREHGGRSKRWLFPLSWSERSAGSSRWNGLLGLLHHEREGLEETHSERWWAWPLVSHSAGAGPPGFMDVTSLVGSARWEGGRHFQVGASLLHSSKTEEDDERIRSRGRTLLFFTHEEERFVGPHVPASSAPQSPNRIAHESRGFLFDAFVSERETYHVWRAGVLEDSEARALRAYSLPGGVAAAPERAAVSATLAKHGVVPSGDDPASVRAAIAAFAAAHTRTVERRHVRIPLLLGYERTEDELEWSAPLGLVHYERAPANSSFSLLYYGYRSATENGQTQRDIFPFITWDSGPEESRVSFLWRVFRYERRGQRRGGYVFFIPWGDT